MAVIQKENAPDPTVPFANMMRFDDPIPFKETEINNRSLQQLLTEALPLHSPVDGLPDQVWKQNCGACHNWDQTKLCAQGKVYAKDPKMISRLPHPFGIPFKVAVMEWAKNGCK